MRLLNPIAFNPTLQFRYSVLTSKLPMALFYARSADQPTADNSPIEAHYGNSSFWTKGKTKWNDINLTCYQYEGITLREMWLYFQQHQIVEFAKDQYSFAYKHDLQLAVLNPMMIPIGTWSLHGAFYSTVNFGNMDWGNDDVAQVELTIKYDYALYRPFI